MPSTYLEHLLSSNALRASTLQSAAQALELPTGSQGLDVGCGAGLQCLLLAEAVGAGGHVTGLDVSTEFLGYGEKLAEDAGLRKRISFKEGSAEAIPFDDDTFDWVWSADCVGYGAWEPMPLLKEMRRVTRPGGTLAVLAWSSENLLPGYPLLEAKLRATTPGLAPFAEGMNPSRHFHRGLGMLKAVGIADPKARVFSGSAQAPLSEDLYLALADLFEMRWPGADEELSENERADYLRLCKKESPEFILNHSDYYAFFTYSMFYGRIVR